MCQQTSKWTWRKVKNWKIQVTCPGDEKDMKFEAYNNACISNCAKTLESKIEVLKLQWRVKTTDYSLAESAKIVKKVLKFWENVLWWGIKCVCVFKFERWSSQSDLEATFRYFGTTSTRDGLSRPEGISTFIDLKVFPTESFLQVYVLLLSKL